MIVLATSYDLLVDCAKRLLLLLKSAMIYSSIVRSVFCSFSKVLVYIRIERKTARVYSELNSVLFISADFTFKLLICIALNYLSNFSVTTCSSS